MTLERMQQLITTLKDIQATYCADGNLPALNEKISAVLRENSTEIRQVKVGDQVKSVGLRDGKVSWYEG